MCGAQYMFVQDFLRVRQDETLEGTYLYEYQELAGLLSSSRRPDGGDAPPAWRTQYATLAPSRRSEDPGEMPGGKYRKRGLLS